MEENKSSTWGPKWWAYLFLVQMITFGLIYIGMPHSFFHSTAHLEPSVTEDREILEARLTLFLEENRLESGLAEIFPTEGELSVTISTPTDPSNSQISVGSRKTYERIDGTLFVRYPEFMSLNFEVGSVTLDFSSDPKGGYWDDENYQPWMRSVERVEGEFVALFQSWYSAMRGVPSKENGLWVRMFYLSVVTSTTLGFGDIVPLTSWARFWVGLQSVLGLVTMGGFISTSIQKRS